MCVRIVLNLQKLKELMHALKVNDGFAQLQNMKKGNKLHILFLFSLVFHNLELNAIMPNYGLNLFILNMLAI
jgi:hypothetical protein